MGQRSPQRRAIPGIICWTRTGRTTTASPSAARSGFPKSTTARTTPSSSSIWKGSATIRRPTLRPEPCPPRPIAQGDFSCALYATTTNCTGPTVTLTDPTSGYQFLQNQIFDPNSTFTDSNGRLIRTPFPNNMIPMNRLDPVALKIQALIPAPSAPRPR